MTDGIGEAKVRPCFDIGRGAVHGLHGIAEAKVRPCFGIGWGGTWIATDTKTGTATSLVDIGVPMS